MKKILTVVAAIALSACTQETEIVDVPVDEAAANMELNDDGSVKDDTLDTEDTAPLLAPVNQ